MLTSVQRAYPWISMHTNGHEYAQTFRTFITTANIPARSACVCVDIHRYPWMSIYIPHERLRRNHHEHPVSASMDIRGCSWMAMHVHCSRRRSSSTNIHEHSARVFVDIHEYPWISIHEYPWISIHDYPWRLRISRTSHECLQACANIHGHSAISINIYVNS